MKPNPYGAALSLPLSRRERASREAARVRAHRRGRRMPSPARSARPLPVGEAQIRRVK